MSGTNYTPKYGNLNTEWTASAENGTARLQYRLVTNGSPGAWKNAPPIKGVCYSPCQIGDSNNNGPNIGDWFWDSRSINPATNQMVFNWRNLWSTTKIPAAEVKNTQTQDSQTFENFKTRADLDNIVALGANMIRVYCMLPYQYNSAGNQFDSTLQTHNEFLDLCYDKELFVLVGYPTPATFWQKGATCIPPRADWEGKVYEKFLEVLGKHPAVMGFTMLNETDGEGWSYLKPGADAKTKEKVEFYWTEVEALAKKAKNLANGKLVGQALHEGAADGQCTEVMLPYINKAEHVDYWGINTYQTLNLDSIFRPNAGFAGSIGFNALHTRVGKYPNVNKPVLLTEIGWPATGHNAAGIYSDGDTQKKTATMISNMIPLVFREQMCIGMFYFEYCDEWWGQPGQPIYEWDGGDPASGFPNGFWDIEGFGLYHVAKNPRIKPLLSDPNNPANWCGSQPAGRFPYDQVVYPNVAWGEGPFPLTDPITPRTPCINALKRAFS